jgi:trans-feruloyl-CoA hydratase/vanillin synthase
MTYQYAEDDCAQEAANSHDNEGRKEAFRPFIDEESFKPGIGTRDLSKQSTKA